MNWLAHLLLSPPDIDLRLGNVLADTVRGAERECMGEAFHQGVRCHALIDAFTDSHMVVLRSMGRIETRFRRFAGVLVDVFYDHLLTRTWDQFCTVPLRAFTEGFHEDALQRLTSLPETASTLLRWMIAHDRLYSYRETSGMDITLHSLSRRLNRRLNRDIRLQDALPGLMAARADLEADFVAFFPDLVEVARGFWAGTGSANLQHLRHDHIRVGKLELLDGRAVECRGVE